MKTPTTQSKLSIRDGQSAAHAKGVQAHQCGIARHDCPFFNTESASRNCWLNGWDFAYALERERQEDEGLEIPRTPIKILQRITLDAEVKHPFAWGWNPGFLEPGQIFTSIQLREYDHAHSLYQRACDFICAGVVVARAVDNNAFAIIAGEELHQAINGDRATFERGGYGTSDY